MANQTVFSFPHPSNDISLIPLEPVNKNIPADKDPPWFFYIYESPFANISGSETILYTQSLKLKNWEILWFIVDRQGEIYFLGKDFNFSLNNMTEFKIRCYVRYNGALYDTRRVTWESNSDISYNMQFCQLTEEQLDACRPEVLLLPAKGVEVPSLKHEPSFVSSLIGSTPPNRINQSSTLPTNVVMLMIDTLRRDHTPPGGHETVIAPHIDMLSKLGTYFQNSYGASSSTRPSVGSIFTGLQPIAHGAERHATDGARLYSGVPLMAESFQKSGFQTVAVSSNAQITDKFGFDRGFDAFECPVWENQVTPKGLSWLQKMDEPFFLYLHYLAPHQPYEPPDNLASIYEGQNEHPEQDRYCAEITLDDRRIGKILKELAYQGLLDRTFVWLVSDHGEEFWEHGWNGHGAKLYEESVQTVSIVTYPHLFPMGLTRTEYVTHVDMFPTMIELFGWTSPKFQQGKSLLPLLKHEQEVDWDERPLYLHHGGGDKAGVHDSDKQAVLVNGTKLIHWTEKDQWEYYNLNTDSSEQTNLVEPVDVAGPKQRLQEHLNANQSIADYYKQPQDMQNPPELTANEIENLRALGYIE